MKFLLFLFSGFLIACSNPALAQCNSTSTTPISTLTNTLATTISSILSGISGLVSSLVGLVTGSIPRKLKTSIEVIDLYLMSFLMQNYSCIESRSVATSIRSYCSQLCYNSCPHYCSGLYLRSFRNSKLFGFSPVIHSPVVNRT